MREPIAHRGYAELLTWTAVTVLSTSRETPRGSVSPASRPHARPCAALFGVPAPALRRAARGDVPGRIRRRLPGDPRPLPRAPARVRPPDAAWCTGRCRGRAAGRVPAGLPGAAREQPPRGAAGLALPRRAQPLHRRVAPPGPAALRARGRRRAGVRRSTGRKRAARRRRAQCGARPARRRRADAAQPAAFGAADARAPGTHLRRTGHRTGSVDPGGQVAAAARTDGTHRRRHRARRAMRRDLRRAARRVGSQRPYQRPGATALLGVRQLRGVPPRAAPRSHRPAVAGPGRTARSSRNAPRARRRPVAAPPWRA